MWNLTAEAVKDDPVIQNGLRESYHRKLYFYANSVLLNGMTPETSASGGAVWWVVMLQVLGGMCLVGFGAFFVLFIINERKERGAGK